MACSCRKHTVTSYSAFRTQVPNLFPRHARCHFRTFSFILSATFHVLIGQWNARDTRKISQRPPSTTNVSLLSYQWCLQVIPVTRHIHRNRIISNANLTSVETKQTQWKDHRKNQIPASIIFRLQIMSLRVKSWCPFPSINLDNKLSLG